jgi:hypothetical protein
VLVEVVVLEDAVEELLVEVLEVLEVLEVVVVLVLVVVLVEVMVVVDVTANIAEACSWRTCALPLRVKETRSWVVFFEGVLTVESGDSWTPSRVTVNGAPRRLVGTVMFATAVKPTLPVTENASARDAWLNEKSERLELEERIAL